MCVTKQLEEYLAKMEDPAYWRTVRDKATGREVVLTEQQMKLVQRLQSSQFPEEDYNQYEVGSSPSLAPIRCPPPLPPAALCRLL